MPPPAAGSMTYTYAPFTPGGDCRATCRDIANRHWSLVVAPSPCLVDNVRRSLQAPRKWKNNFQFRHQMNGRPVVWNSWDTGETQSCWSRTTNMQKKYITAAWRNVANVPQLCLNYLPTVGQQMETVTAKWWVLETMRQQITITLWLHNDNTSAKIETFFIFVWEKDIYIIPYNGVGGLISYIGFLFTINCGG